VVRYLLDTNVISEPPRLRPSARLLRKLQQHDGECAIASVTWHEIMYGIARLPAGKTKEALVSYFSLVKATMPVLPYDDRAAEWHARARALMKKTPPFADGQIAAIAATNDLTLVTADADFKPFAVKVENWLG
jgi:tRNA(fMet)-specific endonuclease VapC